MIPNDYFCCTPKLTSGGSVFGGDCGCDVGVGRDLADDSRGSSGVGNCSAKSRRKRIAVLEEFGAPLLDSRKAGQLYSQPNCRTLSCKLPVVFARPH